MNDVSASVSQTTPVDLVSLLSRRVVGQSAATKAIVPYVYMYQSGLAPEGRPAGVFLLLGILDKGILRLGDNSVVNFEKSLIFFTSNLGAREMLKEINPDIGFQSSSPRPRADLTSKLESIALGAVRKRFSKEEAVRRRATTSFNQGAEVK